MQYAVNRLINSVWTIGYSLNEDGTVTIHSYDRDNPIGYEQERKLPKARLLEGDGRTVVGIVIADQLSNCPRSVRELPHTEYKVSNPQHVFTYS